MRLIDDREKEIENFKPEEYWNVDATLGTGHKSFTARLASDSTGKKLLPKNEAEARAIEKGLEGAEYTVGELKKGKRAKAAHPGLITSTLQQEASPPVWALRPPAPCVPPRPCTKALDNRWPRHHGSDHLYAYRQPAHFR